MKKTFKIMTAMAVYVCFCFGMGATSTNVADASATGIPKNFFGTYHYAGEEHALQKKFLFYITGETSSLFEGPYEGEGIVACSNLDANELVFTAGNWIVGVENQDNFVFKYLTWSKLKGDGFERQLGSIEITGRMKKDASSARISSSEYIRQ
ncbi:MAG: hypothetical protein HDT42_11820 [Ruminococcaceae bacterium]|nr:hypothetical protein [Oscillospiraceae bacterium]